jgi:hypothetical protein
VSTEQEAQFDQDELLEARAMEVEEMNSYRNSVAFGQAVDWK